MAYRQKRVLCAFCALVFVFTNRVVCHEKTLRKMVRTESKMIQRPLGLSSGEVWNKGIPQFYQPVHSPTNQKKPMYHRLQKPKISTFITSIDSNWAKPIVSKVNFNKNYDVRSMRNTDTNSNAIPSTSVSPLFVDYNEYSNKSSNPQIIAINNYYQVPSLSDTFNEDSNRAEMTNELGINSFADERNMQNFFEIQTHSNLNGMEDNLPIKENTIIVPYDDENARNISVIKDLQVLQLVPKVMSSSQEGLKYELNNPHKCSSEHRDCDEILQSKTHLNTEEKFNELDIEPAWMSNKLFWNKMFNSRYESLMRNPTWPPLKVILIPCTHVDTIWKRTFEQYHNNSVNDIVLNVVKKLQFYKNLTFAWNEVSHLSHWWKSATPRNRATFRKLLKEGRLEITTGGWVQSDEATTHVFGLIHQLIEGHQWLKKYLYYSPEVAWLTNSVTHSPTMTYLLSLLNITKLVVTNLHYSWEEYFAEYQYSDFIWVQNWDKAVMPTSLNKALQKIGSERYPKNSVLTHHLQFNSADIKACGPNKSVCVKEFDFAKNHRNIEQYNVKTKSELLLEQYSKTGTITPHNVVIAPLGGSYRYEIKTEFDYQFNNYRKIADFVNANKGIYKASIVFGTPRDYFNEIMVKHNTFSTLKGDFVNFADVNLGTPAYWTGFFTSRPQLKILLRRLLSTLRSTEILLSFTVNIRIFNPTVIIESLSKARQTVARLMDRNVVSGTVSMNAMKYVYEQILNTVRDCWFIQELSASILSAKNGAKTPYLHKYIYRDGEFVTAFRSVYPGDQIYVFNSLTQERTELVEFITKYYNIRIVDHNKKNIPIQVNPVWRYNSNNVIKISRKYFKVTFVTAAAPMTLALFKIKQTFDTTHIISSIYCSACIVDDPKSGELKFPFDIKPVNEGDIQIESFKHRLIFDEVTGFLKTVMEKETNTEKTIILDFGAFRSSDINSGVFLFNTKPKKPVEDVLLPFKINGAKSKITLIISGQLTTQLIAVYGRLLKHSIKIFNLQKSPLSKTIYVENKVDYDVSPKYRELELFMSIQTEIGNGNPPKIFTDNNGFQYTARYLNTSRRIESNMYPITTMAYLQDNKNRLTVLTDHAQGITAFHEGQIIIMLDRRVLFNDGRGTNEGLADNTATYHRHFILLENIQQKSANDYTLESYIDLPSLTALHLADCLNYLLDLFIINKNRSDLCYYPYLPLIKNQFPCNVNVINYRIDVNGLLEDKYSNYTGLLILHRTSHSCQIDHSVNLHCNNDSKFSLGSILRRSKLVYQTNLSGTSKGTLVNNINKVNFPSMEISSLRIHF